MKLTGNKDIFLQLTIAAHSAQVNQRSLPHMLLTGQAGCGKTSTAKYISETTGVDFIEIAHESIKTRDDVLLLRDNLNDEGYDKVIGNKISTIRPTIVFIDEIHRLSSTGQEYLGIAMEEWIIPVEKNKAKVGSYNKFTNFNESGRGRWCPLFTLIGATTNDGLLTKPFKDRFKLRFTFSTYTLEESREIILSHAERLGISIEECAIDEITKRGRGVPRVLVSLLERCRDMAVCQNRNTISLITAQATFKLMGIDINGLTPVDIKIMKVLNKSNGPIGLDNLSIMVNENPKTISETIEPYLIQCGFITRSNRGRVITDIGNEYLTKNNHIQNDTDYIDIPLTYKRKL